ncbi:SdpI family protein [Fulvivirga lutea]|uniref:SdpI family protein n=1 Tax=Fulvivirga lutea TaxID=2810512 RepID=A0A974WDK0_9BACT|nr:SdpI family protein [Fulvivirga lutea]QSE96119.1 SdpI family protein [Fulvivirga lutea]
MHPETTEETHIFIWITISLTALFFTMLIILIQKKGWADERNALVGFRSIMAFRSEKTWQFANRHFFASWLYLNISAFIANNILFIVYNNFCTAYKLTVKYYAILFLLMVLSIEIITLIKFNWKGELRKK